jgi:predicted small integral membrane protein
MKHVSASFMIRLAKIAMVLSVGFFAVLVVFGNITDYQSNFNYVSHVFSMDTTFPGNTIMYRAITSPWIHHAGYIGIIFAESLIALFCIKGGIDLLKAIHKDGQTFHNAKCFAIGGMVIALLVWFFGFQAIAGEWFGMWMSKQWNGLPDATRLTLFISTMLVFLTMKNDD